MLRFLLRLLGGYILLVVLLSVAYLLLSPVSTVMLASGISGDGMRRQWVPIERISPHVLRAVIASEDQRFCEHNGIDWKAVDKAIRHAERTGRKPNGASTITMQVARNLFLWNGRSYIRKALEAPVALWIDLVWPKRRVLEVYLNIAEWGRGTFGIEAAARRNFGVSAVQLSPTQAAMLVTMLPDPTRRSAANPGFAMRTMAGMVERRAWQSNTSCLR